MSRLITQGFGKQQLIVTRGLSVSMEIGIIIPGLPLGRRRRGREWWPRLEWVDTLHTRIGLSYPDHQKITITFKVLIPSRELLPAEVSHIIERSPLTILSSDLALILKKRRREKLPVHIYGAALPPTEDLIPVMTRLIIEALEFLGGEVKVVEGVEETAPLSVGVFMRGEEATGSEVKISARDLEKIKTEEIHLIRPSAEVIRRRDKNYIEMIQESDRRIEETDVRMERIEEGLRILEELAKNDEKFREILRVLTIYQAIKEESKE